MSEPVINSVTAKNQLEKASTGEIDFEVVNNENGQYRVATNKDGLRKEDMDKLFDWDIDTLWKSNDGKIVVNLTLLMDS